MIYFPELRTQRLTVKLRELSMEQSIKLAEIPIQSAELTCSEFLRCAIESINGEQDILNWTVQERIFAVSHYLSTIAGDKPDFSLLQGKYSDYLDLETDKELKQLEVCELGGDKWLINPLTGRMAESIERLVGELPLKKVRSHWLSSAMAAQLIMEKEKLPEWSSDTEYDLWLKKRMETLLAFPASDFESLMLHYRLKNQELQLIFSVDFDDNGIVVLPKTGADGSLPPARFRVNSCLSKLAQQLANRPD
jgi:hypothetical protein